MERLAVVLLLASRLTGGVALAQEPGHRTTVGLALEGGGALALAHIGIIDWFERHHIPIDRVAGASMGGLVGGFYASGMSAEELRRLVEGLDWEQLVNNRVDNSSVSFRRKQDQQDYANSAVLGLRGKLALPTGLNPGQGLYLLLNRTLLPYSRMASFDDLPTPFRCVATDLAAPRDPEKVFDKGSLAAAMRATMAIPGFFEPAYDGHHEYVDGGLINNLPVDIVKAMGADLSIAVYLDSGPFAPHASQSAVDVLRRSVSVTIAANERHNIASADILISVDLGGFGAGDYARFREMISRGFAAAERKRAVLTRFALDDASWAVYQARRTARRKMAAAVPQFVELTGISGNLANVLQSRFSRFAGQPVDSAAIEAAIQDIVGHGALSSISYSLTERDGVPGLLLRVQASPTRPPILQPGIFVDGSDPQSSRLTFAVRISALDLGSYRTEWRNDVIVGSAYGLKSELFRPFRPMSPWFIAPRLSAVTQPFDIDRGSRPLALNRILTAGGGIDLGYSFGSTAELRVGYDMAYVSTSLRVGSPQLLPQVSGRYTALRASYTLNTLDDQIVPQRGVYGQTTARWVESAPALDQSLPVLEGRWSAFLPLRERSSLFLHGSGGTAFDRRNTGLPLFYLGGPQQLSAYGRNEMYGNQYFLAKTGWLKEVTTGSTLLGSRLYIFADLEVARMYGVDLAPRLPVDVNGGIVFRTIIGPLFLGGSLGDAGHRKWYFQLGRLF